MRRSVSAILALLAFLPLCGCRKAQPAPAAAAPAALAPKAIVRLVSWETVPITKDAKGVITESSHRIAGTVSVSGNGDNSIEHTAPGVRKLSGRWVMADAKKALLRVTGDGGTTSDFKIPVGTSRDVWSAAGSDGWRIKVTKIEDRSF